MKEILKFISMFPSWKLCGIFLLSFLFFNFEFIETSKLSCQYNGFVGQIITISKSKIKHCKCMQNQSYILPDWMISTGQGNNQLQGLPVNEDLGIYTVSFSATYCVTVNISQLNNTDHLQFKCNLRWPTLAAIILDVDIMQLSTAKRIELWNALKLNLKGAAGLRLLEDVASFERSIFVLANGLGNSDGRMRTRGVAVVWQIGCGSVEFRHLKTLQWLEKSSLIGEFSQLIGGIPVEMWLVADLYDRDRISRMKREALWQRGRAGLGLQLNERLMESKFSGTLLEGSGMPLITSGSGDKPNSNKSNTIRSISRIRKPSTLPSQVGPTTPFMPVVRRNLSQVILTIQQINNFKIPRETFFDPQQGYSPSLKVNAFYFVSKSKKKIELLHNDSHWISYDKDLQNIRFLPKPAHIGSHKIILCATDKDSNKVCENLLIEVRPPTPITKSTVLQISAGVLWTHEMPSQWLDGLTFNTTADLIFSIEGDAIFCYDQSKAVLQVLTEAIESRILKITFNITNPKEYQTLKYEFTLAVTDISPISHIMGDIFQVKLRWVGNNLYPLHSIKFFLNEFSTALKDGKVADYVDPKDLLIYRVLHYRDFKITQRDTNPDDLFSLQIVYQPSKNVTCDNAALRNTINCIQSKQQLANFYIDSISRIPLKGYCNHSKKPTTVPLKTSKVSTTPPKPSPKTESKPPKFNPSKLIDNLDVEAGFTFLRELNIREAINKKLVLYINFLDEDLKNITDSNWIGLSSNATYIFGLPLKQHIRSQSYKFWFVLYTVTGHILKAPFNINVKPNTWMNRQINHIIKLRLKFIDKSDENQKLNSLIFRVKLVKEIDRALNPSCGLNCAKDVLLFDLKIMQKSLLLIEWSYLPVLDTDGDLKEPGLQCPWNNLMSLYKNINGISNYPIGPQVTQQIPSQALSEALGNAQVGSVVGVTIQRMDSCAGTVPNDIDHDPRNMDLLPNITSFCGQGFRVPIKYTQSNGSAPSQAPYLQLFHETNVLVPKSYWLSISAKQQFIYGLPMSIHATSRSEYLLQILPQFSRKIQSRFTVIVLPSPFHPSNLNHEVIIQFGFFSFVPYNDNILNGLDLRWKIASSLDSYLRPKCRINTTATSIPECSWRLDVILFDLIRLKTMQSTFEVRWSLRSLLQYTTIRQSRSFNQIRKKRQTGCPEDGLSQLKRMLINEKENRQEPQPNLFSHLKEYANVKLKSITLKRLGPCINTNEQQIVSEVYSKRTIGQEDSQKMFLITTVIPVCAFTICILFVALMIALCMKRRNYSGYMKASQNSQFGPGSPVILPDEIDRSSYPPSKPLILPHEKPPLPPPDYNHDSTQNFVTMTTCSYRGPIQTMSKMTTGLEMTTSSFGRQQTPSIRSSPHSHDRFPHGVFG